MDFNSNTKIARRIWFSFGKFVLRLALVLAFFVIPNVSRANIFTDAVGNIVNLFSGQDVSAQSVAVIENNSSTTTYEPPAPSTNSDPLPKTDPVLAMDGDALLPEVGPSTDAPEKTANSNDQISIYTVRNGDTLARVAEMFGVSINTILWANDMTRGSTLRAGQTLVILPISGVMHTVASGDTLSTIAKKYGADVNDILSFNDLSLTDKLTVGDTILIPDGEASYSISNSSVNTSSASRVPEPLLVNTSSLPSYSGYYAQPFLVGHRTQGLHGHNAVDYGMPVGSPLYAAAGGTVIISKSSGWNGGYGNYVVIEHPNGTQTVYGHMNYPVVSVGQVVTQGQSIGYSGNSGKSTGPHLHFEVRGAKNPF